MSTAGEEQRRRTISSHTNRKDILVGLSPLRPIHPEVVYELRVDTVVPGSLTKQGPFDGDGTHHGLFVARAHDDTIIIGQRLILRIVNAKCAM